MPTRKGEEMTKPSFDIKRCCSIAGLGCLMALVLLALMSRLVYSDYDLAFASQLPLTISGDAGCLLGCAAALAGMRVLRRPAPTLQGFALGAVLAGLGLGVVLKAGIGGATAAALVVGDAVAGFFTVLCALFWWRVYQPLGVDEAVRRLACALAAAVVLFLAANAVPGSFGGVACFVTLVAVMGAAMVPFLANDGGVSVSSPTERAGDAAGDAGRLVPVPVVAVLALAFFVVDFELDLFPISLYFEDMVYGAAPTPAVFCCALALLFAAALFAMALRGRVSLGFLYTTGFLLTALGYLLTPYRMQGGFPLAAAEMGRLAIVVFAIVVALRLSENESQARAERLFAICGLIMFASMLAADAAVVLMQMQDGFDYGDFTFRTLFASCGIAVLVVLLIGPLPRVRELLARRAQVNGPGVSAESFAPVDARALRQQQVEAFADAHDLTTRETEVLQLIAAGRDVPYIEQELVLAKSTVKTHIKYIYEKCAVSSRQALLDKLEGFEGEEAG